MKVSDKGSFKCRGTLTAGHQSAIPIAESSRTDFVSSFSFFSLPEERQLTSCTNLTIPSFSSSSDNGVLYKCLLVLCVIVCPPIP